MSVNFKKHIPFLTEEDVVKLNELERFYTVWNEKINVISRKDIHNLNKHHVLHSLAICKFIQFRPGTKILDLGTGGGFPGLPLAIAFPECQFVLVDSRGKKLNVIEDIISQLNIKNVRTIHSRAEDLTHKFDFIVTRAVARTNNLIKWGKGLITKEHKNEYPNGIIALKGGNLQDELGEVDKYFYIESIPLQDYFNDDYFDQKYLVYIQV